MADKGTDFRMRYLRVLFPVIVIILFCLFLVRKYEEPYPALLFPSGEGVVKTGEFQTYQYHIIATTDSGDTYSLSPHNLLETLPAHYRHPVLMMYFGTKNIQKTKKITLGQYKISVQKRRSRIVSQVDREEFSRWMKSRLHETLRSNESFKAVTIQLNLIEIPLTSSTDRTSKIGWKKTIQLND